MISETSGKLLTFSAEDSVSQPTTLINNMAYVGYEKFRVPVHIKQIHKTSWKGNDYEAKET